MGNAFTAPASNDLQGLHELATSSRLVFLKLSHNSIAHLAGLESLARLETLLLDCNAIDSMLQLRPLSILPRLHTMALAGNPVAARISPQQMRVTLHNIVSGVTRAPAFDRGQQVRSPSQVKDTK